MLLSAGDLFGILEEGGGSEIDTYGENVIALKPIVLCRMIQYQIDSLLHKYLHMVYRVTKPFRQRIVYLQQRFANIMNRLVRTPSDPAAKSSRQIRRRARQDPLSTGLNITQDGIIRLVGSRREVINKILSGLRQFSWIRSSHRTI